MKFSIMFSFVTPPGGPISHFDTFRDPAETRGRPLNGEVIDTSTRSICRGNGHSTLEG